MGQHESEKLLQGKGQLKGQNNSLKIATFLYQLHIPERVDMQNKELKKLDIKEPKKQFERWGSDLKRACLTEESLLAKNHSKKCSPSLFIRKM